jgi:prephenate dehydrogenase
VIRERANEEQFELSIQVLKSLGSNIALLSWEAHDQITTDTQAVTHLAFLRYPDFSMSYYLILKCALVWEVHGEQQTPIL